MERRDAMLEAIDQLIEYYNQFKADEVPGILKINNAWSCPLCAFDGLYGKDDCEACPWVVFEGGSCNELSFKRQTTAERLERLNRWKTLILEASNNVK